MKIWYATVCDATHGRMRFWASSKVKAIADAVAYLGNGAEEGSTFESVDIIDVPIKRDMLVVWLNDNAASDNRY